MLLRPDCPLCQGDGMLPLSPRLAEKAKDWPALAWTFAEAIGLDVNDPPRFLCCQICDSGEIAVSDIECDPDVY